MIFLNLLTRYIYHLEVWRLPRCPSQPVYLIYLGALVYNLFTFLLKKFAQKPLRFTISGLIVTLFIVF